MTSEVTEIVPPATTAKIEENKPKTIRMELLKHYVPKQQPPAIVGWNRPEKKMKDSAGNEKIVQEAGFVEGEMAPPPFPGVGYANKVWSGTIIEVPEDEGREMKSRKIAEAWI